MSMSDFWNCSLWEFSAAVAGWQRAQGGEEKPEPMSAETFEALKKKYGYA